jgi:hypothetical protein
MRAARVRTIALGLPEAEERETWGDPTFRVRDKIFVILRADGKRASLKATRDEQRAVVSENPNVFYLPEYVARHGWIGVRLPNVDPEEMRELITEAWRLTAPKRLVKAFDEPEL